MKPSFKPKTKLEKFGLEILNLLVENFSQSYFVGGMVRDLLTHHNIKDIDIATEAVPEEVMNILKQNHIKYDSKYKNFGIILPKRNKLTLEIATFRKESYKNTRYPKIDFTKSIKTDSKRRDFTINSLYFKPNFNIIDYYKGLNDLKTKTIRFIGSPSLKIKQDSLRIVRALRFSLDLKFKIEKNSKNAIEKNFLLIKNLTETKLKKEIAKSKNKTKLKKIILKNT